MIGVKVTGGVGWGGGSHCLQNNGESQGGKNWETFFLKLEIRRISGKYRGINERIKSKISMITNDGSSKSPSKGQFALKMFRFTK